MVGFGPTSHAGDTEGGTGVARRDERAAAQRRARERRGIPDGIDPIRLNPEAVGQMRTRLPGCLLSASILAAPFVGLLYDIDLALGIAVVALAAAAYLAWDSRALAPVDYRRRLRTVAVVNAVLAGLVLLLLVLRLATGIA